VIFAEIGFLAAMKINTYEEMSQVNTYILLPMSFLCGTFFSTHALPTVVRYFIEIMPLTHTSYLLRGIGSGAEIALSSVLVLLVYAGLGLLLGSRAFRQLTR
jgi:ABC-type polysaccharide/polyol phosphate export permease